MDFYVAAVIECLAGDGCSGPSPLVRWPESVIGRAFVWQEMLVPEGICMKMNEWRVMVIPGALVQVTRMGCDVTLDGRADITTCCTRG